MKQKKFINVINRNQKCKAMGCGFNARCKGYCVNHYETVYRKDKRE